MLTRLTSLRVVASLALPFLLAVGTLVLASVLLIREARIGMPRSPAQVIVLDDLYPSDSKGFGG